MFFGVNNTSFRMNGIVGMNDKTEISYVDDYLNDFNNDVSNLHHNTISAINNRYISSCSQSSLNDNLTMWRLYGDDSKGACMIYKIQRENIKNHVLLHKVSYADRDRNHPQLEFLKLTINDIKNILGLKFVYQKLRYWQHFFKPFDYSTEKEVRLLVIDSDEIPIEKRDWMLTDSHSIIAPYIDIKLNHPEFPLILSEIILGPKCPEIKVNKFQLEELLRRKKSELFTGNKSSQMTKVSISKIKNYR
ncbi:MAG: hypothetical protein CFE24_11750 [Flavobacterium sp. BFFFF2]|nr:MAG: hypothetical protein CFE24_11750 [Flavobacterium sp. BFFFF2]